MLRHHWGYVESFQQLVHSCSFPSILYSHSNRSKEKLIKTMLRICVTTSHRLNDLIPVIVASGDQ